MTLRDLERSSIRRFVQSAADDGYLSGRVLDYGCGNQPYRDIVEAAGGEYAGYDKEFYPANVSGQDVGDLDSESGFSSILCTQVVQYVQMDEFVNGEFFSFLKWLIISPGFLVLTWPICWPLVEKEDLHRFTVSGMERLLTEASFEIIRCEVRAEFKDFPIGGQAVARA